MFGLVVHQLNICFGIDSECSHKINDNKEGIEAKCCDNNNNMSEQNNANIEEGINQEFVLKSNHRTEKK